MDETAKIKESKLLILGMVLVVVGILCGIFFFLIPAMEKATRKPPIPSDTITYFVTLRMDGYKTNPDSEYFVFNHGPFPRTDEELSKCIDFTTQIVRTEPPYAWTGCYGDLTFPLANEYNEADMMTIEVSCYPGVTVSYEFSSLDHDGLRVIEAGEVVFSVPEVWYVEFLDLNKDNFPELLVECSGINDGYEYTFFAYDFYNRKSYRYTFEGYGATGRREYNGVMIERWTPDGYARVNGDFVLTDGKLEYVERPILRDASEVPMTEFAAGEPFCWFDLDKGDAAMRREIRLPEYPDCYFVAEKTYLMQCFPDGREREMLSYEAPVSVYFADTDGDGLRELFVSSTTTMRNRYLKHYQSTAKSGKYSFDSNILFGDAYYTGTVRVEDVLFTSQAEYVLEDGHLSVRMRDPYKVAYDMVSEEIVKRTEYCYDDGTGNMYPVMGLLRPAEQGKTFKHDRQGLVVLAEYPDLVIEPNSCAIRCPDGGSVSYSVPLENEWGNEDAFLTVFADLDGDGIRELCLNDSYVIDVGTAALIAKLDDGYRFVWYDDELWVAQGAPVNKFSEIALSLVGKPVLKDGKIEIVPVQ